MSELIKKILVPIDFSDYSKNALKYAIKLCEIFKAEIQLIYVLEPIIYPADFTMGQVAIPTIDIDFENRSKEELNSLAEKLIPDNIKYKIEVWTKKILKYMQLALLYRP